MKIGYACLTIGVQNADFKSVTMKNATKDNLLKIITHNLNSLERIIDYNIKNNIQFFRISSDLIPFGSSPVNDLNWWEIFREDFSSIGGKIKDSNMRVSMHPGQYTVLNSPDEDVVKRAIEDLNYHNRILKSLGTGRESKIILHIGGVYNDRENAMGRFIQNYNLLSDEVKMRLVIENDDKSYNIGQVLDIGRNLNIPVVYDNLHNQVLPFDESKDDLYWISEATKTWKKEDGAQKIHYSQQDKGKRPGSHSRTIDLAEFIQFTTGLHKDIDIMLEVKDKNLSCVKCINGITENPAIKNLEWEWSKYKYNVLEHSNSHYNKIRQLLKDKENYPVVEFYSILDEALNIESTTGGVINGALHVWGYFKSHATEAEKNKWLKLVDDYEDGNKTINNLKSFLWKMSEKYKEEYLLNSYYFYM